MDYVRDVSELETLYSEVSPRSVEKVFSQLTPHYQRWIEAARFVVLSTIGPEGTDASPRGDDGPVVRIADPKTLLLPDWAGNNRIDSLRNIVRDPRLSLMFMVPGCVNVVRVNGTGRVFVDEAITKQFERAGKHPRSVVQITIGEIYFQCAKALYRSGLWTRGDESAQVPTAGEFVREFVEGFDAKAYDSGYPGYAKSKMW